MRRDAVPVTASWSACGASVRGVSHLRDGLPNQDAIASWTSDDPAVRAAIVVLADGHGGARHCRSAPGARFAVDESLVVLRDCALRIDRADPATRERLVAVHLPRRIVAAWTARVRAHLAAHPLSEAEQRAVADDPLLAYGTTLLAALVTDRRVVLTQVGDGDILAVDADGSASRPLPPDARLTGNRTTSLCRAGAEDDFRSAVLPRHASQAAYVLSTDGYADAFANDSDFVRSGSDLVEMIARDGVVAVERRLDERLRDASAVGSGDDITLGILQCIDDSLAAHARASRGSVLLAETRPSASPDIDPPSPTSRTDASRSRWRRAIALAVLIAALVGALLWSVGAFASGAWRRPCEAARATIARVAFNGSPPPRSAAGARR